MKKIKVFLMVLVLCLGIVGCGGEKGKNESETEQQQEVVDFGTVEKETVDIAVGKFNAQVVDNSSLNPAMDDYFQAHNGNYWYALIEGINLVIVPQEFTGDKSNDITNTMILMVDKGGKFESDALSYYNYLVKSNNPEITDDEIDSLLDEAKRLAPNKKTAVSGKGITIGYYEEDTAYQYQVLRVYE